MAGHYIDALVDQRIGRLRFFYGHRPFAGKNHLTGNRRIDTAGTEQKGIDIQQYLRNGFGSHKADFFRRAGMPCRHPVQILPHADIAEIGTGILRVLVGRPQAAAMLKAHVGIFRRRPPEETPEIFAFMQIADRRTDGFGSEDESETVFSGWMFGSNPALNPLEHPVYDVWVIDCRA